MSRGRRLNGPRRCRKGEGKGGGGERCSLPHEACSESVLANETTLCKHAENKKKKRKKDTRRRDKQKRVVQPAGLYKNPRAETGRSQFAKRSAAGSKPARWKGKKNCEML